LVDVGLGFLTCNGSADGFHQSNRLFRWCFMIFISSIHKNYALFCSDPL